MGADSAAFVPESARRADTPALPEISQHQALRHYLRLSQQTMGMDLGSDISEGTCTMKYSPKAHEDLCRMPQMAEVHPLQDEETLQGALQIYYEFRSMLCAISGMDEVTLQGGGGAQAAYTNACVVRAYHAARGELAQRDEMITTIFSHPCDAAAPATAGFKVVTLRPDEKGYPPLDALKAAVGERTAGIMITNPEDTGIYNPDIDKFVEVVHEAGGLAFTDQANANAVLGIARARDAGFDGCHFNLHKTFSSPHACAGPATGAYCCSDRLAPFLPVPVVTFDGGGLPPRLRPPAEHRPGARVLRQPAGDPALLGLVPLAGPSRPARGVRGVGAQQQLHDEAAARRARRLACRTPRSGVSTRCATASSR